MRRAAFAAAVVLGVGGAACASILGIEDGKLDPDSGDGGIQICTADSGVQVDTAQVFVSAEVGADDDSCGDDQSPCKTIKAGLEALPTRPGAHIIYLATSRHAEDVYSETVTLPAGVELQGGWSVSGNNPSRQWQQICQDQLGNREQIANIVGTDNVTIRATDTTGETKLTNLYIGNRPPASGESLIGILASGEGTVVTLTNVLLDTPHAGDGQAGKPGDPGQDAPDASCDAGSGMTPEAGAQGNSAGLPTITPDGVQPSTAGPGEPGSAGANGPVAEDAGCVTGASCENGLGCMPNADTVCGSRGLSGCGGGGGQPGTGGQSGGSAIAIFAVSGAVVMVQAGTISVGNGGAGGAGGAGGLGGSGSRGAAGPKSSPLHSACGTTCLGTADVTAPGSPGTEGASGSSGGSGGGGAGGDAFVYVNLDASITSDAAISSVPSGGSGGDPGGTSGKGGTTGP